MDSNVPTLVALDDGVVLSDQLAERIPSDRKLAMSAMAADATGSILSDALQDAFREPQKKHYVFYAASLERDRRMNGLVREIVDAVAGIDCYMGEKLLVHQHAQASIVELIAGALFVIADITEEYGVNTLIEAGIAMGAKAPLYLMSKEKHPQSRFMFRDREVYPYRDDLGLLGYLHQITRPHRRRVLTRELGDFQ